MTFESAAHRAARPQGPPDMRTRPFRAAVLTAALLLTLPATALAGTISGAAFQDADRDGVRDVGESALSDQRIYLYDAAGAYHGNALTAADGTYAFNDIADGDYRLSYSASSWWALRENWVPTTTAAGGLRPDLHVTLSGAATANFGWRQIVRSTDPAAPITTYAGGNGLTVKSYNDVVPAFAVYQAVMAGTVGIEAPRVEIRFGIGTATATGSSVATVDGRYSGFGAICTVAYLTWLDGGDTALSHEYGHAWSLYHALMTQQDSTFAGYLRARGLEGDARVDSSYGWDRMEMIAEDYRQLLGSPSARVATQTNRDIPAAASVSGLREFLATTFTTPPSGSGTSPTPSALTATGLAMNPSPVRTSGTAGFTLSDRAAVTATVTTSSGALVKTLIDGASRDAGAVAATWNRTNTAGKKVGRGTYRLVVSARAADGRTASGSVTFSVQ